MAVEFWEIFPDILILDLKRPSTLEFLASEIGTGYLFVYIKTGMIGQYAIVQVSLVFGCFSAISHSLISHLLSISPKVSTSSIISSTIEYSLIINLLFNVSLILNPLIFTSSIDVSEAYTLYIFFHTTRANFEPEKLVVLRLLRH